MGTDCGTKTSKATLFILSKKKKTKNVRRTWTQKTTWRHDGRPPSPTMRRKSFQESDQEETEPQKLNALDVVPSNGHQEWTHPVEMIICQSCCLNCCFVHL